MEHMVGHDMRPPQNFPKHASSRYPFTERALSFLLLLQADMASAGKLEITMVCPCMFCPAIGYTIMGLMSLISFAIPCCRAGLLSD